MLQTCELCSDITQGYIFMLDHEGIFVGDFVQLKE